MKLYYLTYLTAKVVFDDDRMPPIEMKDLEQLVLASSEDSARDKVIADFKKEYPKGIVYKCRVQKTLIAD